VIVAVDNVRVMRDMATGRARGFAFVEMSSDDEAQKAINDLHEHQLDGRALVVNEARPKPEGGFLLENFLPSVLNSSIL